jgi:hypothetical protein
MATEFLSVILFISKMKGVLIVMRVLPVRSIERRLRLGI